MQFSIRKPKRPPTVIIISLIDILIVLLIFLTATTTFKHQAAIKVVLPESTQAEKGKTEADLIVTIAKDEPHLYLGKEGTTLDNLRQELRSASAANDELVLAIRADTDAPLGIYIKVMDLAKEVRIRRFDTFTQSGIKP